VLLTPLYLLVFTPGAFFLKWQRRDPMHRASRDPQHTCWIARSSEPSAKSYERQFMLEDKASRGELRPVGASIPLKTQEPS